MIVATFRVAGTTIATGVIPKLRHGRESPRNVVWKFRAEMGVDADKLVS